MKTQLKDSIWIEGFDTMQSIDYCELLDAMSLCGIKSYIYKGKTSDIPEELAKECVHVGVLTDNCKDYQSGFNIFETAKESIKSACSQEYCIIYKTK